MNMLLWGLVCLSLGLAIGFFSAQGSVVIMWDDEIIFEYKGPGDPYKFA